MSKLTRALRSSTVINLTVALLSALIDALTPNRRHRHK
jgi:hypothetical protein